MVSTLSLRLSLLIFVSVLDEEIPHKYIPLLGNWTYYGFVLLIKRERRETALYPIFAFKLIPTVPTHNIFIYSNVYSGSEYF
jgi:hypothetical protein